MLPRYFDDEKRAALVNPNYLIPAAFGAGATFIGKVKEYYKGKALAEIEYNPDWPYCGPGMLAVRGNKAVNKLCYVHDKAYMELGKHGRNPKYYNNDADADFIRGLKRVKRGFVGEAALRYFQLKDAFFPSDKGKGTGLVPKYHSKPGSVGSKRYKQAAIKDYFRNKIGFRNHISKMYGIRRYGIYRRRRRRYRAI